MTAKAFTSGTQCPPLDAGKLRLYSMRFCPYAQRTRLVLDLLKIPHEVVNINLKDKPEWFLAKNPFGLVPVLEQDDKIVYESSVCDEYLIDAYGDKGLIPTDPYQKARAKIFMETYSKVTDKFYGLMRVTSNEDKKKVLEDLHKALKFLESALTGKYFGGDQPNILDVHVWPWFERMPMLGKIAECTVLPEDKFPKLSAWVASMLQHPTVQSILFSDEMHEEFVKAYLTGAMPNYDMGLQE